MDEQLTYHGFWPAPMRSLAQISEWMDWMRPLLYCLLAVAVIGLGLVLLDMAMFCWKEFQASKSKNEANADAQINGVMNKFDTIELWP